LAKDIHSGTESIELKSADTNENFSSEIQSVRKESTREGPAITSSSNLPTSFKVVLRSES
jgi:hypothetical protein